MWKSNQPLQSETRAFWVKQRKTPRRQSRHHPSPSPPIVCIRQHINSNMSTPTTVPVVTASNQWLRISKPGGSSPRRCILCIFSPRHPVFECAPYPLAPCAENEWQRLGEDMTFLVGIVFIRCAGGTSFPTELKHLLRGSRASFFRFDLQKICPAPPEWKMGRQSRILSRRFVIFRQRHKTPVYSPLRPPSLSPRL